MSDREASEQVKWHVPRSQNCWLKLAILLLPVSLMLILHPESITQDGPAHLASGKIANEILAGKPVVSSVYRLQFKPIPNWAGQALAMLSLKILPETAANLILNLLGLWLPALGLNWLIQSHGQKSSCDSWARQVWISLSAMNVVWLFGFTSFLIGLSFAWMMIGLMHRAFERKTINLFMLATFGWCILFLSHLVAYALAGIVFGVILTSHFLPRDAKTSLKLAATTIPSLGLLINYRRITGGSKLEPIWEHLDWSNLTDPGNWARQIGWIDPVSLASKRWVPLLDTEKAWGILVQPVFWISIAASILFYNRLRELIRSRQSGCRPKSDFIPLGGKSGTGTFDTPNEPVPVFEPRLDPTYNPQKITWPCFPFFLAFLTISLIGILGPDTLGPNQGHYLPQRVCLMAAGLFALNWPQRVSPVVPRLLVTAWVLQVIQCSVFIVESASMAREISAIRTQVSSGSKVVSVFDATPWPFRANPRLHRDSLVVFAGDDIASWNLYEAGHAYFPLQFINSPEGLEPEELEQFSLMLSPADSQKRKDKLSRILRSARRFADAIVVPEDLQQDFMTMINETHTTSERENAALKIILR